MPLTVIRPSASQQTTLSPGMPDHPLDQVPGTAGGREADELQHRVQRAGLAGRLAVQPATRVLNTTTSPRWKSVIFCTTTRSPTSSVFSIDSDGMMNICPTKARSRDDTMSGADHDEQQFPDERGEATPASRGGGRVAVTDRRV